MDYKKRNFKLPAPLLESAYSYELAYELGAQYQEELIKRKSEYLKEVQAHKLDEPSTDLKK